MACRVTPSQTVIADGEQFPFGNFNSPLCACDHAPYDLAFGEDVQHAGVVYHTFRLYPKPCVPVTVAGLEVCSTVRSVVNKIALRLDVSSAPCFDAGDGKGVQLLDQAANYRGVKFWYDSKAAPESGWLSARAGYTFSRRSIELYIYALKGSYTDGRFLLSRCDAVPTVRELCKRSYAGLCLYALVDTPGHNYVAVCRAGGLV